MQRTRIVLTATFLGKLVKLDCFILQPSNFQVSSDAPTGTFLLQVRATDRDSGPGGQVSYSIIGIIGSTSSPNNSSNSYECENRSRGVFIIGQYSGVLIVASHLASLCLYTIRITARDHGIPSLSNLTTVRVQTTSRNFTTKLPTYFAFLSRTGTFNDFEGNLDL